MLESGTEQLLGYKDHHFLVNVHQHWPLNLTFTHIPVLSSQYPWSMLYFIRLHTYFTLVKLN
jgi:hypothetical protein